MSGRISRLGALVALAARTAGAGWTPEVVEDTPRFRSSSLAIDSAGNPVLAFGQDGLYSGRWDGSSWQMETVLEESCPDHQDVALDAAGEPAVCFHEAGGLVLRLGRRVAGNWTFETIATDAQRECSLAFDPAGEPVVGYVSDFAAPVPEVRIARRDVSGWRTERVDDGHQHVSVAIDGSGEPSIAYDIRGGGFRLARRGAGGFTIEVVDPVSTVRSLSLGFDAAGVPGIGVIRTGVSVALARPSGLLWTAETIDSSTRAELGAAVDLAFDGALPVVAYSFTESGYKVAFFDGSTWVIEVVDGGAGTFPVTPMSLALDAAGAASVSYMDVSSSLLTLARRGAAGWSQEPVLAQPSGPWSAALAFDAADQPAVAYLAESELRLARFDGTSWTSELVDLAQGNQQSFAFDPAGDPAVAYTRADPYDLVLARRVGGVWTSETIEAGACCPSLAFDPAGLPAVAYTRSSPTDEIVLARSDGAAWTYATVDRSSGSIGGVSLVFDPAGLPALSYVDEGRSLVKLARALGSAWQVSNVASSDASPFYYRTTLAFDAAGDPVVCYPRERFLHVGVAFGRGSSFDLEVPDPEAWRTCSLALDAAGRVSVSYRDQSDRPRFARREGGVWSVAPIDAGSAYGGGYPGTNVSLAYDGSGRPGVAYIGDPCDSDLRLSRPSLDDVLHRGLVGSVAPGWKAAALPLDAGNDDESAPFPIAAATPGAADDASPPDVPLVLYRLLGPAGEPRGNALRVTKSAPSGTRAFF